MAAVAWRTSEDGDEGRSGTSWRRRIERCEEQEFGEDESRGYVREGEETGVGPRARVRGSCGKYRGRTAVVRINRIKNASVLKVVIAVANS